MRGRDPAAAPVSGLQVDGAAGAVEAADPAAANFAESRRAAVRLSADRRRRQRSDPAARGEPLGERIVVAGRVLDEDGRAVPNTLVELWQCNAAGRYLHAVDDHPAPLDPNFSGAGRTMTDAEGRYRFVTIKPGAYPWRNHPNAWRPAHIHFSLFGTSFLSRLVTQMYFPNDPLFPHDPIFNSIPGRTRAAAADLAVRSRSDRAGVGARLPLRHRPARAGLHAVRRARMSDPARPIATSSQTVGPFFHFGLATDAGLGQVVAPDATGERIQLRIRVLDGDGGRCLMR